MSAFRGILSIEGQQRLVARLAALPDKIEKKVVREAVRDGTKIAQKRVKQYMPKKSGLARRKVKVRAMKRKKGRVGFTVLVGSKDFVGKLFYVPMVEKGHGIGKRSRAVKKLQRGKKTAAKRLLLKVLDRRARVPGVFMFKRAFDDTKDAVEAKIVSELQAGINRAIIGAE